MIALARRSSVLLRALLLLSGRRGEGAVVACARVVCECLNDFYFILLR